MISPRTCLLGFLLSTAFASASEPDVSNTNLFAKIDTNNDRRLTKDELTTYYASINGKVPAALWKHEDKDGDGVITWDEFSGPKGHDEF